MELRKILSLLAHKYYILIGAALLLTIVSMMISMYLITPQYETEATLIVNKSNTDSSEYSYNDILLSQKLVNTYNVIIASDSTLSKVISNLNLNISTDDLRKKLDISGINNTEIISIKVVDADPVRAMIIANEITSVSPREIMNATNVGSVKLIDEAALPSEPISPNIALNTILAGVLGLFLAAVFIIAVEYLDRTIKTPEDVESKLDLPVLGQIPRFNIKK
jgi:capsular polysaccharide biosynthesis protein